MTAGIDRGLRHHQIVGYEATPQNLLINGGFEIWQRGWGPFTAEEIFTADEWYLDTSSAGDSKSVQRSSSSKFGDSCLEVTSWSPTVGRRQLSIKQGIEAGPSLHGMWITFCVWVKTAHANQVQARILDSNVGGSGNISTSNFYTGSNEWEQLVTFVEVENAGNGTGDSNDPHGFGLWVSVDCYQAISSPVLIDGAICAAGKFPEGIPYIPRHPADDWESCQRFFQEGPNFSTGALFSGNVNGSSNYDAIRPFAVPMQATPTVTIMSSAESGRFVAGPSTLNNINDKSFRARRQSQTSSGRAYFSDRYEAEVT